MFRQLSSLSQLTAVVCRNQTNDRRPHERQHEADPALIKVIDTPGDREDIVAVLLPDDMGDHRNARDNHAEKQIKRPTAPALSLARNPGSTVGIHDNCQAPEHAHEGSWYGDIAGNHDFYLDITEARAIPPGGSVVGGPDEGIDDVEQVEDDGPADQTGGWDILVFAMEDQWSYAEGN